MITTLGLRDFKSWQTIDNLELAAITGLFGTNSSGKTSILQLLLMLKQTIDSSDRAQVLEFGDEQSLTNLGSFHDVVYSHRDGGSITLTIGWQLPTPLTLANPESKMDTLFTVSHLNFICKITDFGENRIGVSDLAYSFDAELFRLSARGHSRQKFQLRSEGSHILTRTVGRAWDLPAPVKFYGFPDQVYAYYQNAGFLSDLQLSFENLFRSIYYLGPLREFPQRHYAWKGSEPADMGRRGERVVDAMLAAQRLGKYLSPGFKKRRQSLEERVAFWLKELGLIAEFKVEPIAKGSNIYQVKVKKTPSSPEVFITDVGFGVSQVLPVIVLCYYVPINSIVLLEQPEIHLHPSVQAGLADIFVDAMKTRGIQFLIESHSEHLIKRLQLRIADETMNKDAASLYFCEPGENGSKITTLKVDTYGQISNWPKGFFGDEFDEMAAITKAVMKRKLEGR